MMNGITRHDFDEPFSGAFVPLPDGDYVLYTDHVSAIAAKDAEIERLKDENRLLTGVIDDHRRMSQEALSDEAFTLLPLDALRRIAGECSE